jgi:hypothetical protein
VWLDQLVPVAYSGSFSREVMGIATCKQVLMQHGMAKQCSHCIVVCMAKDQVSRSGHPHGSVALFLVHIMALRGKRAAAVVCSLHIQNWWLLLP